MKSSYKVLFVCLGNICRSPAGENVFRHLVDEAGLSNEITCDSAGTIDLQSGKSPNATMSGVLRLRGYAVTGRARCLKAIDLDRFDLIVTMDHENRADVGALATTPEQEAKIRDFTDFCRHHSHTEVPDPYGGGEEGFELVADLIEDGAHGLLDDLRNRLKPSGPARPRSA